VSQTLAGADPILSLKEIRKANSREGLNLAVWTGLVRPHRPEDHDALGLELMGTFHYEHLGYRLKEFVTQPAELEWSRMVLNGGSLLWEPAAGCYRDGRSRPLEEVAQGPFLLGSSHDLSHETLGGRFSPLFVYLPPIIYFRPAEQRLLLAALKGLSDEQIGEDFGISLSAVKKTWRSALDRASVALLQELPTDGMETKSRRGKERRRPLLAYLRGHMEELRPVLASVRRNGPRGGAEQ